MVILGQDGEKWACEACLKGHRVSSCTHKERPLFHVNKKGRPVSQCQHCRGLRKSRAAHVKCVCAEHGIRKDDKTPGNHACQCINDKPCTCSVKRDTLQGDDLHKAAARNLTHRRAHSHGKPAMLNRRSDSLVPSRPQLGHHPQLHRNNNAAHDTGFPYTIPQFTSSTPTVDMLLARSSDSLPLVQPPRPGGLHRASLSTSNLPQSFAPVLPSNVPAEDRSGSVSSLPTPAEDFTPDNAFLNPPMSPNHHTRYSFNDFTNFTFPDFGDNTGIQSQPMWAQQTTPYGAELIYRQSSFAASTGQLPEWPELDHAESPQNPQPNLAVSTPQRSSVISMEQPGLTHSPSNTASDAESSAHNQDMTMTQKIPQPAMQSNQLWTGKEYVDPHSLEMGPASYTSTQADMSYRSSEPNHNPPNEFWPDYFQQTGPASSIAESVASGLPVKQEHDEFQKYTSRTADFEDGFDGELTNMNFDWDNFQAANTPGFEQT